MSFLVARSNDALKINPPTGSDFHLSVNGSDWLWAVCAIYCFSLLGVVALAYFAKSGEKIFHYLFTISLFVGAVAYFAMASDLGWTPVETSTNEKGLRQVFYAKYINWFIGWTPLIIAIGLFSGVSWATIVYNVALSWTWIASWLSGALIPTHYKWGFFAFGTFAYILLSTSFLTTGLNTAKRLGITSHYLIVAGWLAFLWLLYPIAYGCDEGNKISVTSGFIFEGVLDVLMIPLLSFVVLALSTKWDYRTLNVYFTQYGRVAQTGEFQEKGKTVEGGDQPAVVAPEQTV